MQHMPLHAGSAAEASAQKKDDLLRQADQMLYAERRADASRLAGVYELKWLMLVCMAIAVPVFGAPYALTQYYALLVCYYGAIIGFVVAGWGMVRAFVTARRGQSIYRFIAVLYLGFFLFFFVLYGALMFSPTLDKRWVLNNNLGASGLRRK